MVGSNSYNLNECALMMCDNIDMNIKYLKNNLGIALNRNITIVDDTAVIYISLGKRCNWRNRLR